MFDLLNGFYENTDASQCFLIKHCGKKNNNVFIYHIEAGTKNPVNAGFWGLMRTILEELLVADRFNFIPVVEIGKYVFYFNGEKNGSKNVFEYYFEPVSHITYSDVYSSANVIPARTSHINLVADDNTVRGKFYDVDQNTISRWANSYRKHIKLNKMTDEYVYSGINCLIGKKKTLGVHIRGTDFNIGYKNHPIPVDIDTYIKNVNEIYTNGSYEQIFLATDDSTLLDLFIKGFGSNVVYFKDVMRGNGNIGVHTIDDKDDDHNFKRGLEVIRDAYALAYCSGLIAGLSYVSFAARIIKCANNEEFSDLRIISNGIYNSNTKEAKSVWRKINHELHKNAEK